MAHAPRTFGFSHGLGVGKHSNKKKQTSFRLIPQVSFCTGSRSEPASDNASQSQAPLQPQGRFPGHPARRRCGPVPRGHWQPAPSPPHTHCGAQPRGRAELCTARRGYSRSFRCTISSQLLSSSLPSLRLLQETSSKGQEDRGRGSRHLSSRFPQALLLSLLFLKGTKLVLPPPTPLRQVHRLG